jgi:hypothetical protein
MLRVCTWLVALSFVAASGFAQQVVGGPDGPRQVFTVGVDGPADGRQVIINGVPAGAGQIPMPPPPPPGTGMPARDNSVRTGTARIRGRVFAADNGAPLRKAQVRLVSPELRENRLATTDVQGTYEFKDLPAGRYTLTANKGSFVSLQYGQTRPLEPGKPLQILDAQTMEKVDFSLPRGSVITGRIVDEFGEPVTDVMVAPMRYQYQQGRRRLVPSGRTTQTNDIGEFRLFGLPPGQYYLSATFRGGMGGPMDAVSDDRSGYAPTYYPGTPNIAEAQRITVSLGQSLSDVSMALVQSRTARITGTAVDSSGKPLAGGFLMMMSRSGPMFMSSGGSMIRPDGTFTVSNVAPGEYTLNAQMPGGMPGEMGEFASMSLTVTGDDISNVQLIGSRMISVTGRIIVNQEDARSLQPSSMRIMTGPVNPDQMMMGGGGGRINDDLSFEVRTRPGLQMIRLQAAMAMPSGWSTRAVRYNGVDVTDTGIDFRPNEDVSGIEIELTNHPSEVSGLVTTVRGEPSKDYTVVVFAQDSQKWGFMSRYLSTGRPDQDGRFKIRNLPAGSYYAVALDYIEQGDQTDPEVLDKLRDHGTLFSLNEGETKTLDLKLQTGS